MTELSVLHGTNDLDWAKERLKDLQRALGPVLMIMDDLNSKGMQGQFRLGINGFGKNVIQEVTVVKVIA